MTLAETLSIERRWIVSGSECDRQVFVLIDSPDNTTETGHGNRHTILPRVGGIDLADKNKNNPKDEKVVQGRP